MIMLVRFMKILIRIESKPAQRRRNEIAISYFSFRRIRRGIHRSNAIYLNFTLAALVCIFMPYENQTRYAISQC